MDRADLAEKGLTIFFTQVFRDNFFHADMHPGNVFVETINQAIHALLRWTVPSWVSCPNRIK